VMGDLRHALEDVVSHGMAKAIVDLLEPIDINHQEAD
jgi:hypothetical protein